jgi:hypothetical protein
MNNIGMMCVHSMNINNTYNYFFFHPSRSLSITKSKKGGGRIDGHP